ncbi:MAG TPA: hypothetical protein VLK29_05535 [Luteimonas sp.]|nr:hypothetical protein [Luteimonas sp.]
MSDPSAPRNRDELAERLAELRQQGVVDVAEESRLLQHYDEMLRDVEAEKATLEPEYTRRLAEDGKDSADAWLKDIGYQLGRRLGEATRTITDQLRVVTG